MAKLSFSSGVSIDYLDRDSFRHHPEKNDHQGFDLCLDGIQLHFEDEGDLVNIAKKVLDRLGERYHLTPASDQLLKELKDRLRLDEWAVLERALKHYHQVMHDPKNS